MSEINLEFQVNNNAVNFTVESNEITFTPSDINLNLYPYAYVGASGNTTEVQFNNGGILSGANGLTYNSFSQITTADKLVTPNLTSTSSNLTNISNVKIFGGSANYSIQTDGTGNLSFVEYVAKANIANLATNATNANNANTANVAVTVSNASQPNITSVGTLTNLVISGSTTINAGIENLNVVISPPSGNYNFDFLSSPIRFVTANATANVNLNFRGNSTVPLSTLLPAYHSITGTYVMRVGVTPYYIGNVYIDGVLQSIKWTNGNIPSPAAAGYNSYTFTIVDTSGSYTVLGSATRYA